MDPRRPDILHVLSDGLSTAQLGVPALEDSRRSVEYSVLASRVGAPAVVRRAAATALSHGKVPDQVIVLDALPRNAMGKVARAELLAMTRNGAERR